MAFFNDLFSATTRRSPFTANDRGGSQGWTRPAPPPPAPRPTTPSSTYNSQVPSTANPSNQPGGSTYNSQVPSSPYSNPSNVPGGSTYDSQVPSYDSGGSTNSGAPAPPPPPPSDGSGNGGGSSGGGVAPPPVPAPPPPPAPAPPPPPVGTAPMPGYSTWDVMTVPDAAANADYMAQIAGLDRALANYKAQDNLARGDYMDNLNQTLKDLGYIDPDKYSGAMQGEWDPTGKGSYGRSYVTNQEDWAARGGTDSGLARQAQIDMQNEYEQRRNDLSNAETKWTAAQNTNLTNFGDTDTTSREALKARAIQAVAAGLGIDKSMAGAGFGLGGTHRYKRRTDKAATAGERNYVRTNARNANQLNTAARTQAKARQRTAQARLQREHDKKYGK